MYMRWTTLLLSAPSRVWLFVVVCFFMSAVFVLFACVAVSSFSSAGSPQAAFYILQHSKTMSLRFRQQCQTAQAVAEMLEAHDKVPNACV